MSTFTSRMSARLTRLTVASGLLVGRTVVEVGKGVVAAGKDIKSGYEEGKRQAQNTHLDTIIEAQNKIIDAPGFLETFKQGYKDGQIKAARALLARHGCTE